MYKSTVRSFRIRLALVLGVLGVGVLAWAGVFTRQGGPHSPVNSSLTPQLLGAGLELEANSDSGTALYCDFNHPDGTTSTPQCSVSGHLRVGVGPFADTAYFTHGVEAGTGAFTTCAVFKPTTLTSAPSIISKRSAATGYKIWIKATGEACITTSSGTGDVELCTAAATVVAGSANAVCWGRTAGGDGYVVGNKVAAATGAVGVVDATAATGYIGRDLDAGHAFDGQLFELVTLLGTNAISSASATTAVATTLTCRGAGRCLVPALGSPAETAMSLNLLGSEYEVGSSWCGAYLSLGAACPAGKTATVVGLQVLTQSHRYNWPHLSWTAPGAGGAIPGVAGTPLYPRGTGAKHVQIAGFSGANYLTYGAGWTAATFSACLMFRRVGPQLWTVDAGPSVYPIVTHTSGTKGWRVTLQPENYFFDKSYTFTWYDSGGTARSVVTTATQNMQDRKLCWGHDGTNGWITVDTDTPASAAFDYGGAAGVSELKLGGIEAGLTFNMSAQELMLSVLTPTAAYLKSLAAAPCLEGGSCFPLTGNTPLHCDAKDFGPSDGWGCRVNTLGSTWTTTGTLTRSEVPVSTVHEARGLRGAGPASDTAYFSLGTGSVLNFPGQAWSACVAFWGVASPGGTLLDHSDGTHGYKISQGTGGDAGKIVCTADAAVKTTNTINANGPNLACCGFDGTNVTAKLNGGAATVTATTYVKDDAAVAKLGRAKADAVPFLGTLGEVWASNTAGTDATLTRIQDRWLGHAPAQGGKMTITRSTPAYSTVSGRVWAVPANAASTQGETVLSSVALDATFTTTSRSIPRGTVVQRGWTNNMDRDAASTDTNVTVTHNGAVAPDGTMTATAIRETTADSTHSTIMFTGAAGAAGMEYSIYLKPTVNRNNVVDLWLYDVDYERWVRYAYGGIKAANVSTGHVVNWGVEALANGWYRAWMISKATTAPKFLFNLYKDTATSAVASYVGDVTEGIDVWGPQHTTAAFSDLTGPKTLCYPNTAGTAACAADVITVPNPLASARTWSNYAKYSESLEDWTATTTTVSPNVETVDGVAYRLDKLTGAANDSLMYTTAAAYSSSVGPFTLHAWFKPSGASSKPSLGFADANGMACTCVNSTGGACSIGTTGTITYATSTITTLTELSVTCTFNVANTSTTIVVGSGELGVASGTVFAGQVQLTEASATRPFCRTLSTTATTCGDGGVIEKTSSNSALYSANLAHGVWTKGAGVTVEDNSASCPADPLIGGRKMSLVTFGAAGTGVSQNPAGTIAHRAMIATAIGDVACPVGVAVYGATADFSATSTPTMYAKYEAGTSGLTVYRSATADNCTRICVGSVQLEAANGLGAFCGPTGGFAKTCYPEQHWCVTAKDVVPLNMRIWTPSGATVAGNNWYVWSMGVDGAANSLSLSVNTAGNIVVNQVTPTAAAYSTLTFPIPSSFTPGTAHTFTTCGNNGVLTLAIDGLVVPAVRANATTGDGLVRLWQPTVGFGQKGDGTGQFDGTIGSLEVSSSGTTPEAPPELPMAPSSLAIYEGMGSASYPSSLATPTIDCVAAAADGEMTCTGATATKNGNPTTTVGPFYHRGDSSERPVARLDGTGDYYDLGDIGDPWGDYTICAAFSPTLIAANYRIATKGGNSGDAIILRVQSSGKLGFYAFSAGGNSNLDSTSTMIAGSYHVGCVSYDYVANNTSVMRMNMNGEAPAAKVDAVGPTPDIAETLKIGSGAGVIGEYLTGDIRRVSIWSGWAATAAELDLLVKSQWGLVAETPSGSVTTPLRSDSTLCCPFTDARCYWVGANAPCIHSASYSGSMGVGAGIEVYAAASNLLSKSEDLTIAVPWYSTGGITVTTNQGPSGWEDLDLITSTDENTNYIYTGTGALAAGPALLSGWLAATSGTAEGSLLLVVAGAKADCACVRSDGGACTASVVAEGCLGRYTVGTTPVRCWITATATAGDAYQAVAPVWSTASAVLAGKLQFTATSFPAPYRATAGSAYAGGAGTITRLSKATTITSLASNCFGAAVSSAWGSGRNGADMWIDYGNGDGSPNTQRAYGTAVASVCNWYDSAAGAKTASYTNTMGTGEHALLCCLREASTALFQDGAGRKVGSGAGTGVVSSIPASALIGGNSYYGINGKIARFCEFNDAPFGVTSERCASYPAP